MAESRTATSPLFDAVDETAWRERVETDLGDRSFDDTLVSRTPEGLRVEPLYGDRWATPATLPSPSRPGWAIHAEYDAAELERTREEIAVDQRRGVRGLRLAHADGERVESLLEAVDLADTAVHLGATRTATETLDALLRVAASRCVAPETLRGGIGADPIGVLARMGGSTAPTEEARSALAELVRHAHGCAPRLTVLTVRTTPYQRAGAGIAQQVAFALATGTEYLRWLTEREVEIEVAAPSIEFEFSLGTDFFLEIAKLRAARLAWARLVAAAGGSRSAQCAPIHARTSERCWSQRDPWVNLLRGTTGTLAAALGGADSIVTAPFDRAIGRSDDLARRLATNTQAILDEESHASAVRDPAAGSGYLETVTREFARSAWRAFRDLEREGGISAALTSGSLQGAIHSIEERERHEVATRKHGLVGVSEFPDLDEERLERPSAGAEHERGEGAVPSVRLAEPFERLRDASDRHLAKNGARPKVFLANLGRIPEHRARATFAANLFAAGGLEAIGNDGFADESEAAEAFVASGAKLCAICSTDRRYAESVPTLAPLVVERGGTVIVAGPPGVAEEAWRNAGVTFFIHLGCEVLSILEALLAVVLDEEAGVER